MDTVAPGEWRIEARALDHPDAAQLIAEVQAEYVRRYGGPDETPLSAAQFAAPDGAFYVGYRQGRPVATGAWRRRGDVSALGSSAAAEIKRMYVAPAARRAGLARAMLGHLEEAAARAGAEVMILETGAAQPEAIALYASAGYLPIAPYGYYRDSGLVRCMARAVGGRVAG